MRKNILLTALCLSLFSIAAQATLDRSNGFCLAQDGQNLYFSSPESMSFIVMDKTTGALSFYEQPGNTLPSYLSGTYTLVFAAADGSCYHGEIGL